MRTNFLVFLFVSTVSIPSISYSGGAMGQEVGDLLVQTESAPSESSSGGASTGAEGASSSGSGTAPSSPKTKKLKRKKATVESSEEFAGHGAQDSGQPYKSEVDLSFEYDSESKNIKYSDQSYKTTETTIAVNLSYLFILGHFEIGPQISYSIDTAVQNSTSSQTTKTTTYGLGAAAVYNFGNIQTEKMVPYMALDSSKNSNSATTTGDLYSTASTESTSDMRVGLGGGVKFFVASHVAINGFAKYQSIISGQDNSPTTSGGTATASVTGSKMSLGAGIATFF